jgi:DNA-binding transcriptional LysR family regulator
MDRLQAISAFVAVARAKGFSAAARELGVPLPTLSRRVGELEESLGVRLLNRTTRRVELTGPGQVFYAACRRMLDDLREAEESVSGEYRSPRGDLAVTAPAGFGRMHLQPVALEFLAAYPEINLHLLLVDRVVDLLEERVDAALRIAALPDSSLVARPLGQISRLVCASPNYLRRCGIPRQPRELLHHDCVVWSSPGAAASWWLREGDEEVAFPLRVRLATTIADSAVAAAEAGLGLVQATSYQTERAIAEGRLQPVLREFECAPTPVSLVHPSNRRVPLKLRAFIDFSAPRLAARLAGIASTLSAARAPAAPG